MKKRKIIIVITAVTLIIAGIAGTVAINATKERSDIVPLEDRYETRLFAAKTKTLSLPGEKMLAKKDSAAAENILIPESGTKLKYKHTANYTKTKRYDVYTDESGNEYGYDMAGTLLDFKLSGEASDTKRAKAQNLITQEKAAEIVKEYAYVLYGNEFDGFELKSSTELQGTNSYHITFSKKYRFAHGPYCVASVLKDGTLSDISLLDYNECAGFDENLLNGITEQEVSDYAKKQAELKYSSDFADFNVTAILLDKIDDKYQLSVHANVKINNGGGTTLSETYYYPLG